MLATLWRLLVRRLVWVWAGLFLLVVPAYGQAELNLKGTIVALLFLRFLPGQDLVGVSGDPKTCARLPTYDLTVWNGGRKDNIL
jgi:hypothetical protein